MSAGALSLLFVDDHLVAVNKPPGLLVHPTRLDPHAAESVMQRLRDQLGRWVYPVHRLDRPTSGVLLLALDADTARVLGRLFEQGSVTKRYLGVVRGWTDAGGMIDHPLQPKPDPVADADRRRPRPPQAARTRYRLLARAELPVSDGRHASSRYGLLELFPETGRRHQLRRHLKHLQHPLIGDTTWGKSRHNRLFQQLFGCRRLLLHCHELSLPHPREPAVLRVQAPLDPAFSRVMIELFDDYQVG
jgi:tRNA pseudouridine65 synthase